MQIRSQWKYKRLNNINPAILLPKVLAGNKQQYLVRSLLHNIYDDIQLYLVSKQLVGQSYAHTYKQT